MNLSQFLSGVAVAFSVIFVRLIDKYVYDMPVLVGALLAGGFAGLLIKGIQSVPILDRVLKKFTFYILSTTVFVCIFITFDFFHL